MACEECTESTTNDCLETCGCPIEITSLACIRHAGEGMPCIEVVKGDTLEAIIQKIEAKICEMAPGLDGDPGDDGQGIDHVIFTGEAGTEGQTGQTSTYTIYGDAEETIVLGTFVVYNGVDGQGIDHASFTSTDGATPTAGAAGQTDTYTLWADALETISLGTFVVYNGNDGDSMYDSGWIIMNDFNTTYNFGLPAYDLKGDYPCIRVVGTTVFLEGYLLLPLSSVFGGATLLTNSSEYPDSYKSKVQIYTGMSGGYDVLTEGTMQTHNPVMPVDLAPSKTHLLSHFEMSYRAIDDTGGKYELNLTTLFPETKINTDGTVALNTLSDTDNDAYAAVVTPNSPFHQVVSRVTRGGIAPNYTTFYTEYDGASAADKRVSPISSANYPADFDGRKAADLGGFRIKFTTSYPLGEDITLTQIQQAIAQIQE